MVTVAAMHGIVQVISLEKMLVFATTLQARRDVKCYKTVELL